MSNLVVAVSGGVDSVVLLHKLVQEKQSLIVAHFDHGIREDSAADARFVEALAKKYSLDFERGEGKLGVKASEDQARQSRHSFMRSVRDKYHADKIATAHHGDDVIETAIINILRGTRRRGMSSLRDTTVYSRPLLNWSKRQIYDYALEHHLEWVEDETNWSDTYLRNRIRHRLVPLLRQEGSYDQFVQYVEWFQEHNPEIDQLLDDLYRRESETTQDHLALPLGLLADTQVGTELLRLMLHRLEAREIDAIEIQRLVTFARDNKPGDHFNQFPPLIISKSQDWLLVSSLPARVPTGYTGNKVV